MRLTKEQKEKENPLLDDRQLRDKCVGTKHWQVGFLHGLIEVN